MNCESPLPQPHPLPHSRPSETTPPPARGRRGGASAGVGAASPTCLPPSPLAAPLPRHTAAGDGARRGLRNAHGPSARLSASPQPLAFLSPTPTLEASAGLPGAAFFSRFLREGKKVRESRSGGKRRRRDPPPLPSPTQPPSRSPPSHTHKKGAPPPLLLLLPSCPALLQPLIARLLLCGRPLLSRLPPAPRMRRAGEGCLEAAALRTRRR